MRTTCLLGSSKETQVLCPPSRSREFKGRTCDAVEHVRDQAVCKMKPQWHTAAERAPTGNTFKQTERQKSPMRDKIHSNWYNVSILRPVSVCIVSNNVWITDLQSMCLPMMQSTHPDSNLNAIFRRPGVRQCFACHASTCIDTKLTPTPGRKDHRSTRPQIQHFYLREIWQTARSDSYNAQKRMECLIEH